MEKEIASKYLSKVNEFSYIKKGGEEESMCFLRQQTYHLMMKSTPESSNSLERDTANNTASK